MELKMHWLHWLKMHENGGIQWIGWEHQTTRFPPFSPPKMCGFPLTPEFVKSATGRTGCHRLAVYRVFFRGSHDLSIANDHLWRTQLEWFGRFLVNRQSIHGSKWAIEWILLLSAPSGSLDPQAGAGFRYGLPMIFPQKYRNSSKLTHIIIIESWVRVSFVFFPEMMSFSFRFRRSSSSLLLLRCWNHDFPSRNEVQTSWIRMIRLLHCSAVVPFGNQTWWWKIHRL